MKSTNIRTAAQRATALVAVAGLGIVALPAAAQAVPTTSAFYEQNARDAAEPIVNLTPPALGWNESKTVLSYVAGTWDFTDEATQSYQWMRDGVAIPDATQETYLITAADYGTTITVTETIRSVADPEISGTAVSDEFVVPALPAIVTTPVTISADGTTLSAMFEAWTLNGPAIEPETGDEGDSDTDTDSKAGDDADKDDAADQPVLVTDFSYTWQRDGEAIEGATGAEYTVTEADWMKKLTVTVTGASNGYPDAVETSAEYTVPDLYALPATERIEGKNRFATAVEISKSAFAEGPVETVVLATGYGFADALSAAPLAKKLGGPLLLTQQNVLTEETKKEIQRLKPENVVIVGGYPSVGEAVDEELERLGFDTVRLAGDDRFETSRIIAEFSEAWGETGSAEVFIATGMNFPDALSASAAAAGHDMPVLLVNGEAATLSPEQIAQLKEFKTVKANIAGSDLTVSEGIFKQLNELGIEPVRYAGADRIETSAKIATKFGTVGGEVYVAQGWNYPDALAGAAVAGINGSAMVLSQQNCFSPTLAGPVTGLRPVAVTLLGSEAALSEAVAKYDSKC